MNTTHKKRILVTSLFVLCLVLIGAGCAQKREQNINEQEITDVQKQQQATTTETTSNNENSPDTQPLKNENETHSFTHKTYGYTVTFPDNWYWNGKYINTLILSSENIISDVETLSDKNLKISLTHNNIFEENTKIVQLGEIALGSYVKGARIESIMPIKAVYKVPHQHEKGIQNILRSFRFEPALETETIRVHFSSKNPIDCTKTIPYERTIKKTEADFAAAILELLKGPYPDETDATTTIPKNTKLIEIKLQTKHAYVDFTDELESYGGGSCAVQAITAQIKNTLLEFNDIDEVSLSVNGKSEDILQP